jgi:adenosylhomocysteinase
MDMSFANHALVVEWLMSADLDVDVHDVPAEIDNSIASMKLLAMGFKLDKLTEEQRKYLTSWQEGTI